MNKIAEQSLPSRTAEQLTTEWIVVEDEPEPVPKMKPHRTSPTAGTTGLSELSKQLRVLQAKNQAQLLEIDRLQRQLRILADLENVSVADLKDALAKACEAEAYGEMHSRVATLRAELEAITLVKSEAVAVATQDTSHTKVIANLELRVGELEEMDEKHRTTIDQLYLQLQEQQAKSAKVESTYEQLRLENEQLKLYLQKSQELEDVANVSLEQDLRAENLVALNRAREAEMEVRVLSDKLKLMEQQRDAEDKESSLRNAQFKARFMVQDENIDDLRQQLASLYVAFEMLKEEKDRDDESRMSLQALLGYADAEVARQVDEIDQNSRSVLMSPSSLSSSFSRGAPFSPESPQGKRTSITTDMTPLMSGDLLVKASNGVIKKWKKHHASLFATASHFHLDIGEEKGYAIQIGISHVELYVKYPLAFTIFLGGRSKMTLIAAATNQKDFDDWMTILKFATTGDESIDDAVTKSSPLRSIPSWEDSTFKNGDNIARVPTLAEQEESDLDLALEISQREIKMAPGGFAC
jgi:hypothetical protein